MKIENVQPGMIVKVKLNAKTFHPMFIGKFGTVDRLIDIDGTLYVNVDFDDRGTDCHGTANDLKFKDKNGDPYESEKLL